MDIISWMLEITKRERNHEVLLYVENLQELGANPFPYIVFVLPPIAQRARQGRALCSCGSLEVVAMKLFVGGVCPGTPCSARLFTLCRVRSQACPLGLEEEKKDKKKARHIKIVGIGLEGFVD